MKWDEATLVTLDAARALDEMFRMVTPSGMPELNSATSSNITNSATSAAAQFGLGLGASSGASRNRFVEVPKPGVNTNNNNNSGSNVLGAEQFRNHRSPNRGLSKRNTTLRGGGLGGTQKATEEDRLQAQLDSVDEIAAQDNLFRLINQPTNGAMALATTLPRLVRLGTNPASWCLVHALMAAERRVEVHAGAVKMVQAERKMF